VTEDRSDPLQDHMQDHLPPVSVSSSASGGSQPTVVASSSLEHIEPEEDSVSDALASGKSPAPDRSFVVDDEKVRKVELLISLVLRVGVILSVLVITAGLVVTFIHHPSYALLSGRSSYHPLTSVTSRFPHTLGGLFKSLSAGKGQGIIVLGLLLLILTPVMRVAVSILTFVYQRDPLMTLVTCFVLSALIGSFFLGSA